jgi:hypothetical protein
MGESRTCPRHCSVSQKPGTGYWAIPTLSVVLEDRWQSAGQPETGFVFPAPTQSGHIEHYTLKKQHRAALKKSSVRKFLLYSLRHSFATRIAPRVRRRGLCARSWDGLRCHWRWPTSTPATNVCWSFSVVTKLVTSTGSRFQESGSSGASERWEVIEESLPSEEYTVSADGLEPSTHALKEPR